jgi:tetratricopeptide (TPR) repeat protein
VCKTSNKKTESCRQKGTLLLKSTLFFLVFFQAVLYGQSDAQTQKNTLPHVEKEKLLTDLGSPYFIVRDDAARRLKELGRGAIPALLEGIERSSPRTVTGCVALLSEAIFDGSRNSEVARLLDHRAAPVREETIRYLASHPRQADAVWMRRLLREGTAPEKKSLLEGIRRPSPTYQTDLVLAAMNRLPGDLQAEGIRALSCTDRGYASRSLQTCFDRICEGQLGEGLLPPLLDALRDCATPDSLGAILETISSRSPLVREKSLAAFNSLKAHLFRLRDLKGLIALHRKLAALFPRDVEVALDLADAILLYGDDPAEASAILAPLRKRLAGKAGTSALLQRAEACAGLALVAFRTGRDWRSSFDGLSADLARHPGDYAAGMHARILLLEGALSAVEGRDGIPLFLKAVGISPYESYSARIDEVLGGRFSPTGMIWRLSRDNGEDRCLEVFFQMIRALQEDSSRCHYYPSPADLPSLRDSARSGFPLAAGRFLLDDCGDPDRAAATLTSFIDVVQESTLYVNLNLAAWAFYARGTAALHQRDAARAADDIRRGIKIASNLLSGYKTARKKEMLRFYDDLVRAKTRQKALGLLQLATAHTISGGDPRKTESLVREALALAPHLVEVRISHALVLARAGLTAPAAGTIAAVEDYPDQFYNKAILFLYLGRREKALEYLERYFGETVRPRGMALAREWARNDLDLKELREDPRFCKLVGSQP